jgi:hypothetical protein
MVNRILLAAIVFVASFLAGRPTNALVPDWWIDDHTVSAAAVPDRWLSEVARKSIPDLLRERATCDAPRFTVIGLADALCPPDDRLPRH